MLFMKRLFEMTRMEILKKGQREDPAKYSRRLNYVNSIKPMSVAKDLFIRTGTLTVPVSVGDYTVTIHVSGIMKLIRKELDRSNKTLPDRPLVYKALREAVDTCQIQVNCTCPDFCLVGETEIKLINGKVIPVSEMKDMFDNGEQLYVYSVDENGEFVPGKVLSVWISGSSKDFIKITLDNEKEIITTPEHLYLKRDGTYVEARNLKETDSLMCIPSCVYIKKEFLSFKNEVPVYDIMVEGQENFLVDAGVILHNCYRHSYWATKNDYKYGEPERRPANITNPNNKGAVCKHSTAALVRPSQWLKYVSGWISTVVRAYLENKLGINAEDIKDLDKEDIEEVKDDIEAIQNLEGETKEFDGEELEVKPEEIEEPEVEEKEEQKEEPKGEPKEESGEEKVGTLKKEEDIKK